MSTTRQAVVRPQSGTCLGERYQLESLIAVGGMGEVWRAHDTVLDRDVALKKLRDGHSGPDELARFEREARHSAAVAHPGLATVYDFVAAPDGSAYLVVELVDGEPLSAVIARDAPLPPDKVIDLVAGIADALGAVHVAGLVHRDVKPGNIVVTSDGKVKLTDFGIARGPADDGFADAPAGMVMGTAPYMAPEHRRGEATAGSDVFALGVVGFELLTGHRPEPGEEVPDNAPAGLKDALRSAMAPDAADRPASAEEFAAALRSIDPYDVPTNVMAAAIAPVGEPTMRYPAEPSAGADVGTAAQLAVTSRRWRRASAWVVASIAVILLLVAIAASAKGGTPLVPLQEPSTSLTTVTTVTTPVTQVAESPAPRPEKKKKKGRGG